MRKRIGIVLSVLLFVCSMPLGAAFAESGDRFVDVPASKHFAEAVNQLAAREIIGGYPDGTFKPGNSITRGQAAAIIVKITDLDTSKVKDPKFKDVTSANGYYKAIAKLAEKGVISGYGDGRFGPNDPITRGQMASILVKAFDLPRFTFGSTTNPFLDVKNESGHNRSIMSIYRLGITTGTAPDRFSPNMSISRGQAAKMLLATEEAKSPIVTVRAKDFGWEEFKMFDANEEESALFNAVYGSDRPTGGNVDKIHLIPLKEGDGKFQVALVYSGNPDKKFYRKYYVHIKEVDGKLKLTLEETQDFLTTPAILNVKGKKDVENVSLSTMDGELLAHSAEFRKCGSYSPSDCRKTDEVDWEGKFNTIRVGIEKPGRYIATVRFQDGEEIRYGIEAVSLTPHFYYSIRTLEEKLAASVDLGATYDIGRHVLPKDSDRIATVTRDKGTNVFRAVGKKNGTFSIKLPDHKKTDLIDIRVHVEVLGPIIHTKIAEVIDSHM